MLAVSPELLRLNSREGYIEDERRAQRGSGKIGSEAVNTAIPCRFGVFPAPNRSV